MAEQLTMQQKMAVDDRGGKLLVSAAAGSGKTKVLVDRLVSYLLDPVDPANLDEFLIITYTKAAASELRGKIASKLTDLIAQDPDNKHLRQQMQRLYLTKVCTVHSFCGDILREYAYSMDIAPDFRVADETECAQLQMQVLDKILDEAYENASNDPDFCAFIDTQGLGRDDRQIPQIVLKVYQSARCHLDPEGWMRGCIDAANTEGITDAAQTVWGAYLIEDLNSCIALHMDALSKCTDLASNTPGMEKIAGLLTSIITQLDHLHNAQSWDEILSRKNIDYGRLSFSKQCTDVDLNEKIKAIREACKTAVGKKLITFSDNSETVLRDLKNSADATRGLIALTKRFSDEFDKCKRSRRILDFSDLEHKMLDLLWGKKRTGYTAVAKDLANRYREIMVDEYQDSNGVQDAIFDALTHKRNNCFMVGDMKQSIYQFRLADPDIFVQKYNSYLPSGEAKETEGRKVVLSSNFRSSQGIINAVNDVFTNCMSQKVGGLQYGEDERLNEGIPHQPIGETEVELYGITVSDETYAREAAFVAQRISELLDGSHMIRQGEQLRPIEPDDIVILLRSPGSVAGEYIYALESRGIRCSAGGSVDLLQTEEVSSLRSILQVINNPLQDIPLIAVLSSRMVGFTADELAEIRSIDHHCSLYDALCKSENEKAVAFLSLLKQMRMDARLYGLSDLIQRVFHYTRIDSIYAAMPDAESRVENLQTFCCIAGEYENSGQKELCQFLEHLDAMEDKGLVYPGQLQEPGTVTIMSIHKSKGLEFPVVILSGLSRRFNQDSARGQVLCHKDLGLGLSCVDVKNRVRYPSIAKRAISAKIMEESLSEELRVLYVAMTRPKDRLIMTYAQKNLEKKLTELAGRMDLSDHVLLASEVSCPGDWVIQSAMRRLEAGALFALGGSPGCARSYEDTWLIETVCDPDTTVVQWEQVRSDTAISQQIIDQLRESLAFKYAYLPSTITPSKQTATQLKGRSKDLEISENAPLFRKHSFRKPGFTAATVTSTDIGTAIHKVLEYADYTSCADAASVAGEIDRLVTEGWITVDQANMVDPQKIAKLFNTDIGRKLCSGKPLLKEFKFSILVDADGVSHTSGDEVLLQGVVDCAILEDDGITIVDYKTDYVTEDAISQKVAHYSPQVRAYADALCRIYERPIKAAYLYFFGINRFEWVDLM